MAIMRGRFAGSVLDGLFVFGEAGRYMGDIRRRRGFDGLLDQHRLENQTRLE
jgi:hypothetical protein